MIRHLPLLICSSSKIYQKYPEKKSSLEPFSLIFIPYVLRCFLHNLFDIFYFPSIPTSSTQNCILTSGLFNQQICIPHLQGGRHSGQCWTHKDVQTLEGSKKIKRILGMISIKQCEKDLNSGDRRPKEGMTRQVSQGIFKEG